MLVFHPCSSVKSVVKELWRDKLDVVFPRSCVHCGGLAEEGRLRHLCPACERQLFVVEAPHCTTCGHPFYGETEVNRLCEHCEALVPEFRVDARSFNIGASIGISLFPGDAGDGEALLRNADVAMYRAKELGRNNYRFYGR